MFFSYIELGLNVLKFNVGIHRLNQELMILHHLVQLMHPLRHGGLVNTTVSIIL